MKLIKYTLDLSESYPQALIFSAEDSFKTLISTPCLNICENNDIEILIENIEFQMSDKIWYDPIISKNPNSIIVDQLEKMDLNDKGLIFTILLSRAKLIIKKPKCMELKIDEGDNLLYHSVGKGFKKGDKLIELWGGEYGF